MGRIFNAPSSTTKIVPEKTPQTTTKEKAPIVGRVQLAKTTTAPAPTATPATTATKPIGRIFGAQAPTTTPVGTHTFSPDLGGGQFNLPANGQVNLTERGYADLPTKPGEERDHVVSVALGGTSNKENMQYLPDTGTSPAERQSGKVAVEQKVIQDFKDGKITLAEARTKIATKQQQIKGLAPTEEETIEPGGQGFLGSLVDKSFSLLKSTKAKPPVVDKNSTKSWADIDKEYQDSLGQTNLGKIIAGSDKPAAPAKPVEPSTSVMANYLPALKETVVDTLTTPFKEGAKTIRASSQLASTPFAYLFDKITGGNLSYEDLAKTNVEIAKQTMPKIIGGEERDVMHEAAQDYLKKSGYAKTGKATTTDIAVLTVLGLSDLMGDPAFYANEVIGGVKSINQIVREVGDVMKYKEVGKRVLGATEVLDQTGTTISKLPATEVKGATREIQLAQGRKVTLTPTKEGQVVVRGYEPRFGTKAKVEIVAEPKQIGMQIKNAVAELSGPTIPKIKAPIGRIAVAEAASKAVAPVSRETAVVPKIAEAVPTGKAGATPAVPGNPVVATETKPVEEKPVQTFERAKDLPPEHQAVEAKAFEKITKEEPKLLADYQAENGKVVNTDGFRPLFKNEGYNGSNAAAVQEPSSYLSKKAFSANLKNPEKFATFLAGGSGAGKTSAVEGNGSLQRLKNKSAVVFDSNFSSFESAAKKIKEAKAAGKQVAIIYVYREPMEALENGVIKRMIGNPKEMGRVVPSSVVADNHQQSWAVIKKLYESGYQKNIKFIDNSLGPNNAKLVTFEEMSKKAVFPTDLKDQMNRKVEELHKKGTVSKEQRDNYVGSKGPETPPPAKTPPATKAASSDADKKLKSRVYERIQEEKPDVLTEDVTYEKNKREQDVDRAIKLINEDKQQAFRVAMGAEDAPVGQTATTVNIAMAEQALIEGNNELFARLTKKRSLDQTRRGQEIEAEKGSVTSNSVSTFVKRLLKSRMNKIGQLRGIEDLKQAAKGETRAKRATRVIDREVKKAQAKIKSSKEMDLDEAQSFLDSLACK